ncbi:MAG: collagenase [Candidatus Latescibacteria bacterium]|nr:collagenase [Candidatus Latescibacterota bacterium]
MIGGLNDETTPRCSRSDVALLNGDDLVNYLRAHTPECIEYLPIIYSDQNMQSVLAAIEELAVSYNGTNNTGLYQLWYFVWIGYWFQESRPAEIGGPFSEATHRAYIAASEAFAANDHFFDLNGEAGEILFAYMEVANRDGIRQFHLERIKLILSSMTPERMTNFFQEQTFWLTLRLIDHGLAHNDQGFIDALAQDSEIVELLLQLTQFGEFPIRILGRLATIPNLEEAAIAALTTFLMEQERLSNTFIIAAETLEDKVNCTSLNICRDVLRRELHARVLPNKYRFDDGALVFETPLDLEYIRLLYQASKEVKAQFHRLLETDKPVPGADDDVLHVKIFGSRLEYRQFIGYLFGANARLIYSDGYYENATVYLFRENYPHEPKYGNLDLTDKFRHEYAHYLAARFTPMGLYNQGLLTWFHEGLAEFLMGSTQAEGVFIHRVRLNSIFRQEEGGIGRFDPARVFDFSSFFKVHDYNYAGLFFHFMYQQRRTELLELIDLVRGRDISAYNARIAAWAKDAQLAADYDAFVDEQVANRDQSRPSAPYPLVTVVGNEVREEVSGRSTTYLQAVALTSDSPAEIESALQRINGDLNLDCRTVATGLSPRFGCSGALPAESLSGGDQGESSFFDLFDSFSALTDRGTLNERLNTRLDSFIVAAVEDGAISNFEDMTCYFANLVGSPPAADLYCEGPLRPTDVDWIPLQVDLQATLCCARNIGGNATDALVSRLSACGIQKCAGESGVVGEPLYLWTTLGFSEESVSNVTLTWSASLPGRLEVFVPRWLPNQCELVEVGAQTGTLACGPVYDYLRQDIRTISQRRASASKLGAHLELALHFTPLQAGFLDFSVEFSSDGEEIDPTNNIQWLRNVQISLPDSPQLAQNAPNPFNSQTILSYFLHIPGTARLEVFSLTGQRVAVLHQGPQKAGYHRLHWNGRNDAGHPVASGMYLYRLVTDEAVLTRKLMLLR